MSRYLPFLIALSAFASAQARGETPTEAELRQRVERLEKTVETQAAEIRELKSLSPIRGSGFKPTQIPPVGLATPPLPGAAIGFLTIHTTPPTALATILVNGKPWVKTTPFEDEKLPAGTYTVQLKNEGLGWEKTMQVTVTPGKRVILENVRLNPKE